MCNGKNRKKYCVSTSPEITELEKQHAELSKKLAGECVVLLENDGILPLKKKRKIALFGNGARETIKGGTGSGDVNTRDTVNIEQGLLKAGINAVLLMEQLGNIGGEVNPMFIMT